VLGMRVSVDARGGVPPPPPLSPLLLLVANCTSTRCPQKLQTRNLRHREAVCGSGGLPAVIDR